jgi:hypothetical protein
MRAAWRASMPHYRNSRFAGCATGACPLTANPVVSTLYGAAVGALLARG